MTTESQFLFTELSGTALLEAPLLNKGSAFTREERVSFNLMGLLPPRYESIDEQMERAYLQYSSYQLPINKHIYLRGIQDSNETLFYALVSKHINEMMPIIYTPTVGDACERFSDIYRNSRGLFISWEERDHIDDILRNATKERVKIIVVTDGERILGLGDQGIGGMGIPIGKLALYTACGGINPAHTLPVMLDVGTNNEQLLDDPIYMGARHRRISEEEYAAFLDLFMQAAKRCWPGVLVQFEDFAQRHAKQLLDRYVDEYCCFNDDIQGTAAVTLGTILAACRVTDSPLRDHRVVVAGAGSAGCGIAEMMISQMVKEGLTEEEARCRLFMVDRDGLVTEGMNGLYDFQSRLAQKTAALEGWSIDGNWPTLLEVIGLAKPTILIGVSGQPRLFSEEVVRAMAANTRRPIIFPLSNPLSRVEAIPQQVIEWTEGRAIVATGSPFPAAQYDGEEFPIAQCNNSYIFPGVGLGVLACAARRVTNEMLMASSEMLAEASPWASGDTRSLLPPLEQATDLSRSIAFAVAKVAQAQGHASEISDDLLLSRVNGLFWVPEYRQYKRVNL
ncbi:MAG: NAD-dependent malic enzyme [Gammaproteobacteria bacterium]|nr:NAD-dependent malic enzyme [Gammaproteobacteria bacterium]NDG44279.1 NAD-dependent malic enzyme [Gammaproteobacteria bacterium]